jgi:hypothetical protein
MNNEHFLNTWFYRSLKRSRQSALTDPLADSADNRQGRLTQIIDESLFPTKLKSSECYLLPTIDPFHLSDDVHFFEYQFPPSIFDGFHTISFWFFLPCECELAVKIGYTHVLGLDTYPQHNRNWNLENKRQILLADRWTHIALSNSESSIGYHVWINGQDFRELDLPSRWEGHAIRSDKKNAVFLSCKRNSYSIRSPIASRVADLVAFKRCLSMVEIRSISAQQTSIDRVQIGTYVTSRKIKHTNNDQRWEFDSFSCRCGFLLCVTLIAIVRRHFTLRT